MFGTVALRPVGKSCAGRTGGVPEAASSLGASLFCAALLERAEKVSAECGGTGSESCHVCRSVGHWPTPSEATHLRYQPAVAASRELAASRRAVWSGDAAARRVSRHGAMRCVAPSPTGPTNETIETDIVAVSKQPLPAIAGMSVRRALQGGPHSALFLLLTLSRLNPRNSFIPPPPRADSPQN